MTTAKEELELLERVFMRIGSTEDDAQLERELGKFLPPVLLKLSSEKDGVRKKVMELLVHVNRRLKSRPLVRLPFDALLAQYQDPMATSFVINFTIIYLKLGFPRLTIEEQVALVPGVLMSMEGKPETHQDGLMMLLVPLLGEVTVPMDAAKRKAFLGVNSNSKILQHFLTLLLDMLLLPYGVSPAEVKEPNGADFASPPGMSVDSFRRVTNGFKSLKAEDLEKMKLGIVKFLSSGIFEPERILIHMIVGAADTRFSVANIADSELKRIVGLINWNNKNLSGNLYMLFLGTFNPINVPPNRRKTEASTRIRLKLLTYLGRFQGKGIALQLATRVILDALFGTNTNARLKTLALSFAITIVRTCDIDDVQKSAVWLKSVPTKLITEGDKQLLAQSFAILGLLCQRCPESFRNDFHVLMLIFEKLSDADADANLKLQVKEGALNIVTSMSPSTFDQTDTPFVLLKTYVQSAESMVRYVAVRCLASIFPADHVPSRLQLLLATGDAKDDVCTEVYRSLYGNGGGADDGGLRGRNRAEVERSLRGWSEADRRSLVVPTFKEMVRYVFSDGQAMLEQGRAPAAVYAETLIYMRFCLLKDLMEVPISCGEVLRHPCPTTPIIRAHLLSIYDQECKTGNGALHQYAALVRLFMLKIANTDTLGCMIELLGCVPQLHGTLSADRKWLKNLMLTSGKEEIRECAATLYAILLLGSEEDASAVLSFDEEVESLREQAQTGRQLEAQSGAIFAVGYCLERRMQNATKMQDEALVRLLIAALETFVPFLTNNVSNTTSGTITLNNACLAIGLLAKGGPLPLKNDDEKEDVTGSSSSSSCSKLTLVKALLVTMNNAKLATKCRERAARTLGLLAVGERNFPHTRLIIQGLLDTVKETKDVEVHFTIGESLVMCVQGVRSPEARNAWTVLPADHERTSNVQGDVQVELDEMLEWLLGELLNFATGTHPNSKQSSSIWLLALLRNCVDRAPIESKLQQLQQTFMQLLAESNDVVQDVASKGLCLIYDHSKSEDLLTALMDQLSAGRRQVVQVDDNTKLFEEGQLGKAPTGGNLSTYKELCSLASDLNKPDMIYQFMQLANHNAMWNSKKGAAFGFASIADRCGERLQTYLPGIIPKLYRYQYDPSPNLQASMQNIWRTLVSEPQKMLDLYHNEILAELLANLTSPQYRVRQSCCLALQDFLKGAGNRSIHDSVHAMHELWSGLFRVMDDHHEQTRLAATRTARVLSKLCVRGADLSQGKNGAKMIEAIMPVLLSSGITNSVLEIRIVSLETTSELVVAAGEQLKPVLPHLIPALLLATSELESSRMSQLSAMLGAQSNAQEAVDTLRASMAKTHVTMETVTKCLRYVDCSILEELVPRIVDLMKGSVALGTKVVCAHFITLLTVQTDGQILQPYAGRILSTLVMGLTDRNALVRKNYASTIGHVVRAAKDSSLQKLFAKLKMWYFEREDDAIRNACAHTIQSVGVHNHEIFKAHSEVLLPLVFFAMHADHGQCCWQEVWDEHGPGTETAIRQNVEAICETLTAALDSPSWTMKAQAANAISTVAAKLGKSMEKQHMIALMNVLVAGLKGRTWCGKDKLLMAVATICSNCTEAIRSVDDGGSESSGIDVNVVVDAVLREARKEEVVHKIKALEALGDVLESLQVDRFEEVYRIAETIMSERESVGNGTDETGVGSSSSAANDEDAAASRENRLKLREAVYVLLGKAWPKGAADTQDKFSVMFAEHCASYLPLSTRNVQVSIVASLRDYADKLVILERDSLDAEERVRLNAIVDNMVTALAYTLTITKYTRLKKETLNVLQVLAKKLKEKLPENRREFEKVTQLFAANLGDLSRDGQPEIKSRLTDLKLLFKTD